MSSSTSSCSVVSLSGLQGYMVVEMNMFGEILCQVELDEVFVIGHQFLQFLNTDDEKFIVQTASCLHDIGDTFLKLREAFPEGQKPL